MNRISLLDNRLTHITSLATDCAHSLTFAVTRYYGLPTTLRYVDL